MKVVHIVGKVVHSVILEINPLQRLKAIDLYSIVGRKGIGGVFYNLVGIDNFKEDNRNLYEDEV